MNIPKIFKAFPLFVFTLFALSAPTLAEIPFSFQNSNPAIRTLSWQQRPYYANWAIALPDTYSNQDVAGVRMWLVEGKLYDNPVLQAQHAVACINGYMLNHDPSYLDRAVLHAQRLMDNAVEVNGAWFLPYRFHFALHGVETDPMPVPWYSAMAQGTALSVFTRLYEITGDSKYLDAAQKIFASYLLLGESTERPWVVHVDNSGYLWLDEFPVVGGLSDLTLNGFVFAAYGLFDYQQVTGNADALMLLQGALTTVKHYLPNFRVPGYLSKYCLRHESEYKDYHMVHTSQMNELYTMTEDVAFAQMVDLLRSDFPDYTHSGIVMLQTGEHVAYQFDRVGDLVAKTPFYIAAGEFAASTRQTMPGRDGVYMQIDDGQWKGYWVAEDPVAAIWKGFADLMKFDPVRTVTFAPGTYTFQRLDSNANTLSSKTVAFSLATTTQFSARARINSQKAIYIISGPYRGYWIVLSEGIRLDQPIGMAGR